MLGHARPRDRAPQRIGPGSSHRTQIAFLTPVTPAQGGNGLAMRAGLFLEGLAAAGEVHVIVVPVFGAPAAPDGFVRRHAASFAVLPLDDPSSDRAEDLMMRLGTAAGRERAAAVHPLPRLCSAAAVSAAARVTDLCRGADLVHVLRLYLAPFVDGLLDSTPRPRLVLDVDDIESDAHRERGHHEEADRFERLEAHYLPRVDDVIACTSHDAALLADRHSLSAVTVVPNAVRPPTARPRRTPRYDLLFVGNLAYGPNVDAVHWLCHEVLPLLPGATAAIVGSRPGPAVRALAADGRVQVAADVPSVAEWYAAAAVAVVPVRSGGGMRTKVLEAFAHGRPVVSTAVGAAGLDLDGDPALIAESAEDFAACCWRLLDDDELAGQLASRGERLVRRSATVAAVAPRIAARASVNAAGR